MYNAYEIVKIEELPDIKSKGTLLRHRKSGAYAAIIENSDVNKVFNIAFRTTPDDSTGVPHIIEHSVLCGSEKFPLKDPFVELAKGSLNTFLNAMTYPDKTMYPVASCNDTDIKNLMEVYLDAVFYPNIYKNENIFRQEGWHYHIEEKDAPLTYNGVVYNEMKGAFSTADALLERSVFSALFPDTTYGVESGGDPKNIPDLSYEQFLAFHKKYYHPSNSFIYLYGDMDMEERLDWIDKEYLSHFDALDHDTTIDYQRPFEKPLDIVADYPILDDEPLEENTYLNMSTVVCDSKDVLTNTAFAVLEYVLLDTPGAPIKQALLDAGIGKDVDGSFQDGLLQNFFSIDVKYANPEDKERFEEVITDTLKKCVEEGIDKKAIKAAIHYFEFRFREADYSSYPKGLIYGLSMFDTWLYDKEKPFEYLKMIGIYEELKAKMETDYFEELIRTRLLGNPHRVTMTLVPKRGLAALQEEELAKKLADIKASLSDEQIEKLVEETLALKAFQEAEDEKEVLEKLPMLSREDLDKETHFVIRNEETDVDDTKIVRHDFETNGIAYLSLFFDIKDIKDEMLPYLSLLKSVLGYVDTDRFSYRDLSNEINGRTGGINCGIFNMNTLKKEELRYFGVKTKYLYPEQDYVFEMIKEIIHTSKIEDDKRLFEIIAAKKSANQASLAQAGHVSAVTRASAGISSFDQFQEAVSGITYYRFLEDIYNNFEERKEDVKAVLKELILKIFNAKGLIVDMTCEDEGMTGLADNIRAFKEGLNEKVNTKAKDVFAPYCKKEAFKTSGGVQYVATVGNFADKGYEYTGVLQLLRTMMNYDYLWMNLRVKGGAYGCMSGFKRSGQTYLVSYRDPHLNNTLEIFKGLPEYLRGFKADEDTMTKYIIGTISGLDTPRNANANGAVSMNAYFTGLTVDMLQKEREQILNATDKDINGLADMLEAAFDGNRICVVGSETKIEEYKEMFDNVEALVKG